jgi:hypothetical protein
MHRASVRAEKIREATWETFKRIFVITYCQELVREQRIRENEDVTNFLELWI